MEETSIHYFDIHAEEWRPATSWPPAQDSMRFYPAADNSLAEAPIGQRTDSYQADFATTTGTQTRYERLGAASITDCYPDWTSRSASMLTYETKSLPRAMSIVGHPVAALRVSINEGGASIFVYLSEVDANGRVHYITEGMLRAIHRKTAAAPDDYVTPWPFRSYRRADASPIEKGLGH